MEDEWLVWQLADSAFPAGSFAHSAGLEAAWQQDRVSRGKSVEAFIDAAVAQAARGSLPLMLATHRNRDHYMELDQLCNAMLSNHVANRASRVQGQSLLAAAQRIFGVAEITELQAAVRRTGSPTHMAPVFGAITSALMVNEFRASRLFIFCALRGLVSSAVRLGIFGPMEGQAIQARASVRAEQCAADAMQAEPDDAAQTAPMLDLLQGAHDRLYSRLFQS
jgi:urease accessory protein